MDETTIISLYRQGYKKNVLINMVYADMSVRVKHKVERRDAQVKVEAALYREALRINKERQQG